MKTDILFMWRRFRLGASKQLTVLCCCICGWLAMPAPALAVVDVSAQAAATLQRFIDRQQHYDISFLWLDRVAEGRLSLQQESVPGQYRAILEARTLGTAAWITGDRVQRYESVMRLTPSGRLRPLEHVSLVRKGKGERVKVRQTTYRFDDQTRQVMVSRLNDNVPRDGKTLNWGAGHQPDDFLTAFFNFSLGVYGPVRVGGRYEIPTMTRKGETKIAAEILPPERWPDLAFFPQSGMLLQVTLDPEVLDTGGGEVYALLDTNGRLLRGIVENVLGIGDVRGISR